MSYYVIALNALPLENVNRMYYNFKIKASNLHKATEPGALYIEGKTSKVITVCFKPEVRILK